MRFSKAKNDIYSNINIIEAGCTEVTAVERKRCVTKKFNLDQQLPDIEQLLCALYNS